MCPLKEEGAIFAPSAPSLSNDSIAMSLYIPLALPLALFPPTHSVAAIISRSNPHCNHPLFIQILLYTTTSSHSISLIIQLLGQQAPLNGFCHSRLL
jgi:hypothetical protein